jgi:hypothetical protein
MPSKILQQQSLLDLLESGLSADKRLILVCEAKHFALK